jgi:hypothetical protein
MNPLPAPELENNIQQGWNRHSGQSAQYPKQPLKTGDLHSRFLCGGLAELPRSGHGNSMTNELKTPSWNLRLSWRQVLEQAPPLLPFPHARTLFPSDGGRPQAFPEPCQHMSFLLDVLWVIRNLRVPLQMVSFNLYLVRMRDWRAIHWIGHYD